MFQQRFSLFLSATVLLVLFTSSCKKYEDKEATDISDQLNGRTYCNNPLAYNYNWGFPGTADSTTCRFPIDNFSGTWLFSDSVYTPDLTLVEVTERNLTFTPTEDTLYQHFMISGWCTGDPILARADLFGRATTDTLIEYSAGGQFLCSTTDTLSGSLISRTADTFIATGRIKIDFTITTPTGTTYHRGTAVQQ